MRLSSDGSPWNYLYGDLPNSPESVFIFIHGTFANAESGLTNRCNLRIGYASQLLIEDRHCIVPNRA